MTELTADLLLRAYAAGLFPMAESRSNPQIHWVDPHFRGIIPLDGRFHIPRRLRRTVRQGRFEVRCDTAFEQVILACAESAAGREDSWINGEIVALYRTLHERGAAHSVECWRDGRLVGGLYGVSLRAAFFGESMFARATDASKVALVHLVARLRQGGYCLLDAQFQTRHLSQFGTIEIPRARYHLALAQALSREAVFQPALSEAALASLLQSSTQTS